MSGFSNFGSQPNKFQNQGSKMGGQSQNISNLGFSSSGGGFGGVPISSGNFSQRQNVEIDLYGGPKTQPFNKNFQSGSSSKSTTQSQGFHSQKGSSLGQKSTQPTQGGFMSSAPQVSSQFAPQGGFGGSSSQSAFQGFKTEKSTTGSISTGFSQSTTPSQGFSKAFSSNPISGSSFQSQGSFQSAQPFSTQKQAFPPTQTQGFGPKGLASSNPASQSSQIFSTGFQTSVPQTKSSFAPSQSGFGGGGPPTAFQGFKQGPISTPSTSMSSGGFSSAFPSSGGFSAPQPKSMFPPKSEAGVYSDSLTEEEISAFKSDKFELGKVPLNPPTKELCQ